MPKTIPEFVQKITVSLLTVFFGFSVSYLRDINTSLGSIHDKMGSACERIAAMDSMMKSLLGTLSIHQATLDIHESRLDAMHGGNSQRGG